MEIKKKKEIHRFMSLQLSICQNKIRKHNSDRHLKNVTATTSNKRTILILNLNWNLNKLFFSIASIFEYKIQVRRVDVVYLFSNINIVKILRLSDLIQFTIKIQFERKTIGVTYQTKIKSKQFNLHSMTITVSLCICSRWDSLFHF